MLIGSLHFGSAGGLSNPMRQLSWKRSAKRERRGRVLVSRACVCVAAPVALRGLLNDLN